MSEAPATVEVLFLWHHHQPDYRNPRDGAVLLPWVRLHATKDYLDMALHLERHPQVRAAFNFVPSLLDQLDAAAGGALDRLFGLIARPVESLTPGEQAEIVSRGTVAPRHAFERWPRYAALRERLARPARAGARRSGSAHHAAPRRPGRALDPPGGRGGARLPPARRARPGRARGLALLPPDPAAARGSRRGAPRAA